MITAHMNHCVWLGVYTHMTESCDSCTLFHACVVCCVCCSFLLLLPRGSTPASSILGHVQVLASLTWLILASMRGWAVSEATNSDPLTTSEGVQHHTSTIVIHLMEHVSPEYFVEQVAVVAREAISRLAVHGTEEEIKTVFVFIEVRATHTHTEGHIGKSMFWGFGGNNTIKCDL